MNSCDAQYFLIGALETLAVVVLIGVVIASGQLAPRRTTQPRTCMGRDYDFWPAIPGICSSGVTFRDYGLPPATRTELVCSFPGPRVCCLYYA